ncbi:MAG: hypothetical protein ABI867_42310 [Kofleriaceae bacterium]
MPTWVSMVRIALLVLLVVGCGHRRERSEIVADFEAKVKRACACTTLACWEASGLDEDDDFDAGVLDDDSFRYVGAITASWKCRAALTH